MLYELRIFGYVNCKNHLQIIVPRLKDRNVLPFYVGFVTFNYFKGQLFRLNNDCIFELIQIFNVFGKEYDSIPYGNKTICTFRIIGDVKDDLKSLNKLKWWFNPGTGTSISLNPLPKKEYPYWHSFKKISKGEKYFKYLNNIK